MMLQVRMLSRLTGLALVLSQTGLVTGATGLGPGVATATTGTVAPAVTTATDATGPANPGTRPGPESPRPPGTPGLVRLVADPGSVVRSASLPLPGRGVTRLRTATYRMVAFTWRGRAPKLVVRIDGPSGWSPPRSVAPLADQGAGRIRGSQPIWTGAADGISVRVSGAGHRRLRLVLIDPGVLPGDRTADAVVARETAMRVARPARATKAPRPVMLSRAEWGADESWRDGRPRYNRTIQQVHLHQTATTNRYRRRDVPALIRGMYRYHTRDLGWSDIGYNFLVDKFGRIWVGRGGGPARPVRGAHTLGFNDTSVGIATIGTFDRNPPWKPARWAVIRVAAWKLDKYDRYALGWLPVYSHGSDLYPPGRRVPLPVIDGHRDTNQTACPGQELYDLLPRIRRMTQRRINAS